MYYEHLALSGCLIRVSSFVIAVSSRLTVHLLPVLWLTGQGMLIISHSCHSDCHPLSTASSEWFCIHQAKAKPISVHDGIPHHRSFCSLNQWQKEALCLILWGQLRTRTEINRHCSLASNKTGGPNLPALALVLCPRNHINVIAKFLDTSSTRILMPFSASQ
jgi:hypothetical protein